MLLLMPTSNNYRQIITSKKKNLMTLEHQCKSSNLIRDDSIARDSEMPI